MKKILSILACFCFLLVGGVMLTACGEPKLTGIQLDTQEAHITFVTGENFTTTGLRVKGVYDDKSEKELAQTDYEKVTAEAVKGETKVAEGSAFDEAGSYTVNVSYEYEEGKFFKNSYDVTVTYLNEEGGVAVVDSEADLKKAIEHYSTAKLNSNVVLTDTISVSKEFSLDLNGHTISNTENIWKNTGDENHRWSLVSVKEGGKLTIKGTGNLTAKENDCYAVDVFGGQLTIEGGKFNGNVHAVYVHHGTCTINGGEFDIQQLSDNGNKDFLLNCFNENAKNGTANIVVKGGIFHGFNPDQLANDDGKESYVAEGYHVENNEQTYTVKPYEDGNVHVKTAESLRTALTTAKTQTVVLDSDITFDGKYIQLENAKSQIILDLNGHTLTTNNSAIYIVLNAKLTIKNSKENGKFVSKNENLALINVGAQLFMEPERAGHLVIESGVFETKAPVVLVNNGTAEITGGKFKSTNEDGRWTLNIYDKANENQAKIEVSGGEFTKFDPENPNTNDRQSYLKDKFKSQLKGGSGDVYEVVAE